MLTFEDALGKLLAAAQPVTETRSLPLTAAAGRVLAAPQFSTVAAPPLDNSGMDGYAVKSADIPVAGTRLPVSQRIPAGSVGMPLQPGTAARIFTGAPIPAGADAVIMQELCEAGDDGVVINQVPTPGQNIRCAGEDIAVGAEILAASIKLRPQDIALAASAGLPELPVYRRLRVGVFFTGDELVQPGEPLPPGAIYNSNRYALRALLEGLGCEVRDLGQVPDTLDATKDALRRAAADNDLIVTSGGVSVGEEDHVKPAVEAEGRLDMWKIAIKPGKPLAFGEVRKDDGKAWFIGLPGNPVSAIVTFMIMVRPFVLRLQGIRDVTPRAFTLRADFDWKKPDARAEFLRGRRNEGGGVELYPNQGAGVVTSLCWGDGLVLNPPGQPVAKGDPVRFVPFTELL
ncbi:MAG: molybdopterin molybdotransferase MoeA [Azonexus sp.]|nr:molybdopterin molybdotransferase MoeA [Betaproteobacteria bacterium]MBK8917812.1 molybdopterin molybdotransferase MoeA [Betaproteobacteria bacterium]MBP6035899.1 molybdopterin molybdotransferase MoeA [Azonexus sp.]MBP6906283.1 molybdopterin molybdotransferase MoeA [Azonexus sp.]